jgi:hypothetical protein
MTNKQHSRREFLGQSGSLAAGGWLSLTLPLIAASAQIACSRRDEGADFAHLESMDAIDIAAIAEQIMPSDDTPGASDTGVIWFIDTALGGFEEKSFQLVKNGLDQLNNSLTNGKRFADLSWQQQTDVLKIHDSSPLFKKLRFLTVAGMFSMPSRGGNKDKLGWALIGFEDRHAWQSPFGHYDAEYMSEDAS